jgi:hypothetical protein
MVAMGTQHGVERFFVILVYWYFEYEMSSCKYVPMNFHLQKLALNIRCTRPPNENVPAMPIGTRFGHEVSYFEPCPQFSVSEFLASDHVSN